MSSNSEKIYFMYFAITKHTDYSKFHVNSTIVGLAARVQVGLDQLPNCLVDNWGVN